MAVSVSGKATVDGNVPSGVHKDVQPTEGGHGLTERGNPVFLTGNVQSDKDSRVASISELIGSPVCHVFIQTEDGDLCALGGEQPSRGAANSHRFTTDPHCGACDRGYFTRPLAKSISRRGCDRLSGHKCTPRHHMRRPGPTEADPWPGWSGRSRQAST